MSAGISDLTRHIYRLIGTDEAVISKEEVVGWRLSLAFFGTASFFNGIALLLALYVWIINRQTHVRKTKGSHAEFKPHEDVDDDGGDDSDSAGGMEVEAEDDVEVSPSTSRKTRQAGGVRRSSQWRRLMSDVRRSKAWESIMNFEVENDDDVEDAEMERVGKRETQEEGHPRELPPEGRPSIGNLAEIASKIKVFSYLGGDALKLCLSDAEYVDLEVGQHLFERGAFDGSLYVVIAGSVECRFHEYQLGDEAAGIANDSCEQSGSSSEADILSFRSGSGTVVTPLLAMLEALVQRQRVSFAADDGESSVQPRPLAMADGVSAIATENSRLIKIPARCYSMVLEKFPADVHRIAVTIVQRVQRVTLQTLVKTLGLHTELLRRGSDFESPDAWANRMSSPEWYRLASNLSDVSTGTKALGDIMKSIISDASLVAAAELELHPECATTLRQHSTLVSLSKGETFIKTGSPHHALYMVLSGEVEVGPEIPGTSPSFYRFSKLEPGALVGRLACFSGDVSIFSARAVTDGVKLLRIPKATIDELLVAGPRAMISCFEQILSFLSPSVHLVNWCSQWEHVQASEVIARKGDPCESIYMVLNGRIRASYSSNVGTAVEEYGRGRCIGDIGGITKSRWPCKVYAIRNSELARVPVKVFEALIRMHPNAGLHFARVIASQVRARQSEQAASSVSGHRRVYHRRGISSGAAPPTPSIMPTYGLSLATIAVVPLSDVDIDAFCSTMVTSLKRIAPAKLLTKDMARQNLGEKVYRHNNALHELRMTRFLGEVEEKHRLVVFQADQRYTWWTRLCIAQADAILLLVKADKAPETTKVERCLEWAYESMQNRIELVVVDDCDMTVTDDDNDNMHGSEMDVSDALDDWSEQREWIAGHHLVRAPFDCHEKDILRLCRRMTGLSVGLVLGGGGARGLAHLGVIKALLEAGITINMVGGTSQGAFIAALYARSPDNFDLLMERSRRMASRLSSPLEKILDLTLPLTSMFSGYRFNLGIINSLGRKTRIQDLVLKFFCVSTDVQKCELVVHIKGCLWKYVRASMSLSGYLPPVSENGSLLVDGGYMSVVPTDVMRDQAGARTVISVDVSGENEKDYYEYGTHLSGWWLLYNSWNPFTRTVNVPSMGDISDSLRWVSSDQHRRRMESEADLHFRPPIQEYGTLEFDKFDEIVEKGYAYAKPIIDDWVRRNPSLISEQLSPRNLKHV